MVIIIPRASELVGFQTEAERRDFRPEKVGSVPLQYNKDP
jgi:hypothetical protein